MGTDGRPALEKGDIVQLDRCPEFPILETHTAKVLAPPQMFRGDWVVPVSYWCTGSRGTANVNCDSLVKIRSKLMTTATKVFLAIAGFIVFILIVLGVSWNSLTISRNEVKKYSSTIETAQAERYELIDNLVNSVKGSQAQESEVFGKIADARKVGGSASPTSEQSQNANATIDQQIALLPRLQEAYPELKSNEQMSKLIAQLQDSAKNVKTARNDYNTVATNYNNKVTTLPTSIIAGMMNFKEADLFKATTQEKQVPKVDFTKKENQ